MGTPITASTPPQPASSVQHLLGKSTKTPDLCSYVDPHIGSGGHGHVFVGANVPFGLVQLGPTALSQEWDWTSGYHYGDSTVIGFPHTHLSG
ncbi:alpha-1,2-mannosidase family protein, partial [gut metagenome]